MPFDGDSRSDMARVIRSRHFDSVSRTKVNRFETTTTAETVLTLSLRETAATIERLVDDLLARRKVKIVDFDPILERLAGARQRGLPALRRIIAARSSEAYRPPMSELERMLYRLLDHPGIPPYSRQLPIEYPTVEATVDAFIEKWRLIVESDGRVWHSRVADFERDRERDNAAAARGLRSSGSPTRCSTKSRASACGRCSTRAAGVSVCNNPDRSRNAAHATIRVWVFAPSRFTPGSAPTR